MASSDSDDSGPEFDPFDPEVLAANGIFFPPVGDADKDRMMLKWWAYRMQKNCNLTADNMMVPPLGVLKYPDLLEKLWGWSRLLPVYTSLDQDLPLYKQYLCEYYIRNPPESVDGAVAAATTEERGVVPRSAWTNKKGRLTPLARLCFDAETRFMSLFDNQGKKKLTDNEIDLSNKIKTCAEEIIKGVGEYFGAYAAAASLVCIAKETELICGWFIHGQYDSFHPCCIESNQIRKHALSLMFYKGSGSIAAAAGAAMVGAAKEAKLLSQCMNQGQQDQDLDVIMCADIRKEACNILLDICNEASGAKGNSISTVSDGAENNTSNQPSYKTE